MNAPSETPATQPEPPPPALPASAARSRWRTAAARLAGVSKGARVFGLMKRARIALLVAVAFTAGVWLAPAAPTRDHAEHTEGAQASGATVWTCSMHPQIKLPEPGPCPICGMDLIPLEPGGDDESSDRRVSLSPAAARRAELATSSVFRGNPSGSLRMLGRLEYDETAVRTITSWVGGRIDRLYVSTIGAVVGAGQSIARVYSPEVYAAHQDLIVARRQAGALRDGLPVARRSADAALNGARQRLKLLGLRDEEIAKMEQEDAPREQISIRAPFGGTVLEQMVNQGAYVTTGAALFRVAALGRIWVQLDAYENDLSQVAVGDTVTIQVTSFPGELLEGTVTFVDPVLDPQSRTAQVRVEVPNKKGRLRPGMFAEAVLHADEEERPEPPLLIPASAVLPTGKRSVVFVEVPKQEKPTYEVREVQLGPRAGNVYPVVFGLSEGERVVTEGAFALDAELQIRGGKSMMTLPDDLARAKHQPFTVSPTTLARFEPLLEMYLSLHEALTKDDLSAAQQRFSELGQQAARTKVPAPADAAKRWHELSARIEQGGRAGHGAKTLADARQHFDSVSGAVIEVVRRYGNPRAAPVRLAFCPMAFDGRGAEWLQAGAEIQNPYFGAKMLTCGEVRGLAEPRGRLPAPETATPAAAQAAGHQH